MKYVITEITGYSGWTWLVLMERLLDVVTVVDIEPVVATALSLLDNVPTFAI